jgi:hypothetical protein
MPRVRAYVLAATALAAFLAGLALEAAGTAFRGIDSVTAILFAAGAATGIVVYVREKPPAARRIAVVAAALSLAALVMLGAASL